MNVPGYCACDVPERVVREGVAQCEVCGELIHDPLLLRLLGEVLALRRQVAKLERKLTEPKPRTPDWLAPKEFALLLGRSVDFVYRHADELGAKKVGKGTAAAASLPGRFGFFRRFPARFGRGALSIPPERETAELARTMRT
jgi:hypothetical protein